MEIFPIIALLGALALATVLIIRRRPDLRGGPPSPRLNRAIPRDPATGLSNRHGFIETGTKALTRAGDRVVAVIAIDVGPEAPAGAIGDVAPAITAMLPTDTLAGVVAPAQLACLLTVESHSPNAPDQLAGRLTSLLAQQDRAAARTATIGDFQTSIGIDDYTRWRLLEGLDDIGLTLRNEDKIAQFEARRESWRPRTLPVL